MTHPTPTTAPWAANNGTYISGQAALDDVDILARDLEIRWGAGRLRLLVGADLRDKFDRQRYLVQQATEHGDLEAVRVQARRMMAAWRALDRAASEAGASTSPPEIWEGVTEAGVVVAIVRRSEDAHRVAVEGRAVAVYTLDEIIRIVGKVPALGAAKVAFVGAKVRKIKTGLADSLRAINDTRGGLDDLLQDEVPF